MLAHPYCFWCETPLTQETTSLDHIIPLAKAGKNAEDPTNWVLSCQTCQNWRKAKGEAGNPFFPHERALIRMTWFLRARNLPQTQESYESLRADWKSSPPGPSQIALFLKLEKNLTVPEKIFK